MEKGIKYDSGKLRLAEMMQDFRVPLSAVCKVWEFGADKYAKSNWQLVDNAIDRYTNAMLRHLMTEVQQPYDDESELLHAAHVAWNALARLHFIVQKELWIEGGQVTENANKLAHAVNQVHPLGPKPPEEFTLLKNGVYEEGGQSVVYEDGQPVRYYDRRGFIVNNNNDTQADGAQIPYTLGTKKE